MDQHPRLIAYSWDIAGSLLGTVAFAAGSYLQLPPWIWPPLLMLVWSALFLRSWTARAAHVISGTLFVLFALTPHAKIKWHADLHQFLLYDGGDAVGTEVDFKAVITAIDGVSVRILYALFFAGDGIRTVRPALGPSLDVEQLAYLTVDLAI